MMQRDIRTQLVLQDTMNAKVNPEWRSAQYPWHRAIFIESAELMDHLGWKWWKNQTVNIGQVHIELVDIWHFILSDVLQRLGDHGDAAEYVFNEWQRPSVPQYPEDIKRHVEWFAGATIASRVPSISTFRHLCDALNLSSGALHDMYVAKNVLNIFRQNNGYKEGTYFKEWFGKEDNDAILRILKERPGISVDDLNIELNAAYQAALRARDKT